MQRLCRWLSFDWVRIGLIWIVYHLFILTVASLTTHFEPLGYHPSHALSELLEAAPLPPYVSRLAGFDGVHYQTIINHRGYREIGGVQAFFPLYPWLMSLFNFITHQSIVSGLLISSLSLYGFLLLLFRWTRKKTDTTTAWWLIALVLCLPGSFFYLTVYTESLFLFLLLAAFTAYEHKNYPICAVCLFFLSACRIVGILAVVALFCDYFIKSYKKHQLTKKSSLCNLFVLSLGSLGLISYMIHLYLIHGDPLMFVHVQADFGGGRDTSQLVLLPQVFYRYLKMCLVGFSSWPEAYRVYQELLISLAYLLGLIGASCQYWRQKDRIQPLYLLLFSLAAYLIGPATGMLSSMSRYTLVCLSVPLFILCVRKIRCPYLISFIIIMAVIQIINLILFLEGIFIA